MYKLDTQLTLFRYNRSVETAVLNITWYVLERNGSDEDGRCFTDSELKEFQNFVTNHPVNFPGGKNYHTCSEDELTPSCPFYLLVPNPNALQPTNVILRKQPQLYMHGITSCMDIILTDAGQGDKHGYNLKFNVIGRINT